MWAVTGLLLSSHGGPQNEAAPVRRAHGLGHHSLALLLLLQQQLLLLFQPQWNEGWDTNKAAV